MISPRFHSKTRPRAAGGPLVPILLRAVHMKNRRAGLPRTRNRGRGPCFHIEPPSFHRKIPAPDAPPPCFHMKRREIDRSKPPPAVSRCPFHMETSGKYMGERCPKPW